MTMTTTTTAVTPVVHVFGYEPGHTRQPRYTLTFDSQKTAEKFVALASADAAFADVRWSVAPSVVMGDAEVVLYALKQPFASVFGAQNEKPHQ